jgi:hypothetical protein
MGARGGSTRFNRPHSTTQVCVHPSVTRIGEAAVAPNPQVLGTVRGAYFTG